jgi:hypothetical protein
METNFFDLIRDKLPKHKSWLLSAAFFAATLICNIAAQKTHFMDVQNEQEKRITALENQMATREELKEFKQDATSRLDRIESKVDSILTHRK